jgi:osmotically-inducible protein OsmY
MFDRALRSRILHALAANPRVDAAEIAVKCSDGGHVVLRGAAVSPVKSTQAVRTAYSVPGVTDVEDQLRPRRAGLGSRADATTEAAVLNAFIADDALPADTMHVHACDGTVTLSGRVDLPYQRDEAEAVAKRVPGVQQLQNHLHVWGAPSQNEVLKRVAQAIGKGADQLTATAHDGVVTLSGTVHSASERDAAIAAAASTRLVIGVEDKIQVEA